MARSGYVFGGIEILTQNIDIQSKKTFWTLVYIKDGVGLYILETALVGLSKGDMVFLPPGVDYSFRAQDLGDEYNENVVAQVMRFDQGWLDDLVKVFPSMSPTVLGIKEIKNPVAITGPDWMKMASVLDRSAGPEDSHLIVLDLLNLICGLRDAAPMIIVAQNDGAGVEDKLESVKRYLSCNIYKKVSLEEIASYVGMNRVYFCKFFKAHFKENFIDYLNRKRAEHACQLLTGTKKDMASIAADCGFKTVPYFNRVFTAIIGVSPGKYRKNQL